MNIVLVIALSVVSAGTPAAGRKDPEQLLSQVVALQREFCSEMSRLLGDAWDDEGDDTEPLSLPKNLCLLPPLCFYSKGTVAITNCGETFNETDFSLVPKVTCPYVNESDSYTFLLTSCNGYLQWGVVNIPGSVLKSAAGRIRDSTQITEYQHLYPAKGRPKACWYRALLYRQSGDIPQTDNIEDKERRSFKLSKFAKEHRLSGPISGVQAWVMLGN